MRISFTSALRVVGRPSRRSRPGRLEPSSLKWRGHDEPDTHDDPFLLDARKRRGEIPSVLRDVALKSSPVEHLNPARPSAKVPGNGAPLLGVRPLEITRLRKRAERLLRGLTPLRQREASLVDGSAQGG